MAFLLHNRKYKCCHVLQKPETIELKVEKEVEMKLKVGSLKK